MYLFAKKWKWFVALDLSDALAPFAVEEGVRDRCVGDVSESEVGYIKILFERMRREGNSVRCSLNLVEEWPCQMVSCSRESRKVAVGEKVRFENQ